MDFQNYEVRAAVILYSECESAGTKYLPFPNMQKYM